jgi:hypothetical protein
MQEAFDIQGSYLEPITDFASHSPFGGAHWFERYTPRQNPQIRFSRSENTWGI